MPDPEIAAIRALLAASPRPAGLAERRQRMDAVFGAFPLPEGVRVEPVDAGGVAAEWTTAPGADTSRAVLFLHGGGYVSGSLTSHRHMVAELGRRAAVRTLALDYRLAPEHPFPAALDDALAGYRFLVRQGFDAARIAISGESAGGGLALAVLCSLRDAGEALPACAWLSSPWSDLAQTGDTMQSKSAVDPIIQKSYLDELAAQYLKRSSPRDPLASPLYADLSGLPPMLIQVGASETLLDDSVRLARAAGAADVFVTLRIWPEMIHAWHLFYQRLGAGRDSLQAAADFISTHIADNARGSTDRRARP